ncbi:monosaccharide transporter [Talaromyces pinophilus]|uniref:Monosaccharide transporter n=1 Tax=Talaromyces pinophilus TaxID=128442 RepID=A0A6V8HLG2_TALPI|nr:monosaccharide transporter [Talaromyces pinophilus]
MPYLGLKGNGLLAGIALSSGMGFVLFGYDDGVIGGLLTSPTFESTFHLSSGMQGTVTSLFIIGCLVGCLFTGITNGKWGRLTITHAGSIVLSIGATLQASSFGVPQLIVGRIVAGIGLGLITSNVIVWQSESAPRKVRGMLVASALSLLIVGQLLAYWIDYAMADYSSSVGWRFPLAFQAFIAILTSVMLCFMPESPRWLFQQDRTEEATQILRLLQTHKGILDEDALTITISDIIEALEMEKKQAGWKDLLKEDAVCSRRRVLLACLLNSCQAWSGSTPISYYTTVIFQNSVGLSYNLSLLMSGFLQIWFLVASFGTWYTIEKAGRRKSFMFSAACMAAVMAALAACIAVDNRASGIVAAVMIFLYQSFYTWGFMGGLWCYGPEILPLAHRTKGSGLATACLWLSTFVVVEFVPTAITNIGWRVYIIFAVFNLAFIPMIYFLFPETAGFTLEAVDLAFMDKEKGPVKRANELWEIIKKGGDVGLRGQMYDGKKEAGRAEMVENV